MYSSGLVLLPHICSLEHYTRAGNLFYLLLFSAGGLPPYLTLLYHDLRPFSTINPPFCNKAQSTSRRFPDSRFPTDTRRTPPAALNPDLFTAASDRRRRTLKRSKIENRSAPFCCGLGCARARYPPRIGNVWVDFVSRGKMDFQHQEQTAAFQQR